MSFLTNIGMIFISLLTGVLIARGLSVEDRGGLAQYFLYLNLIIPISLFGIYDVILTASDKSKESINNIVKTSAFTLYVSIILVIIMFIVSEHNSVNIILMFIVSIIANYFIVSYHAILHVDGRINTVNSLRFLVPVSYFGLVFLSFIFNDLTLEYIVLYNLTSNLICLVISYKLIRRKVFSSGVFDFKIIMNNFSTAKWLGFSAVFISLSSKIDQVVIAMFLQKIDLAIYIIALSATMVIVNFFNNAIVSVAYPKLASSGVESVIMSRTWDLVIFCGGVYLIMASILYCIYPFLIVFLFGDEYINSVEVAQWLIFSGFFVFIRTVINKNLKLLSLEKFSFFFELSPCLLFVMLILFFLGLYPSLSLLETIKISMLSNFISCFPPVYLLLRRMNERGLNILKVDFKSFGVFIRE